MRVSEEISSTRKNDEEHRNGTYNIFYVHTKTFWLTLKITEFFP
jgi:hypothetical protein